MDVLRRALACAAAVALISPTLALAFFVWQPGHDPLLMRFELHFWSAGATALASALACAAVVAGARTLRETKLLFLALAFISIGAIFAVHGLLTPTVIAHKFHSSVAVSAWISVFAGGLFVALSAIELPPRADRLIRRGGAVIFAWAAVLLAVYVLLSITATGWLDSVPTSDRRVQFAIGGAATALFAFGVVRYAQAYLFARLPSQAAMVCALALLVQVPAILLWGQSWHASWWVYHAVYGAAFAILLGGWALEAKRAGSLRAISDALAMRDALAQLNRGRDARMLELVDAIESKDVATLGHVSRVAAYALAAGRQMGLGAHDLRNLVLAAQMHDVGKIGVPDVILMKRGPLDDDEYAEVKRHAARGGDIALRIAALKPLAGVIRAHHERVGGQGYPDGLAGEDIPLLARIIAVADTYDALTSARPYREARSHNAAVAELQRVSGGELDARCVDAFLATFHQQQLAA